MSRSGRRAGLRFDADYGVDTEALIFLGELDPERIGAALQHATHYEPTPPADFAEFMAAIPGDFPLHAATFYDIGSGLARAVLMAARFPFKQILGVEISPALHAVALDNAARFGREHLRCRDVRLRCGDASTAALPAGDLVLYAFNPFDEKLMVRLVERVVKRERTGRVLFCYHTPADENALELSGAFVTVATLSFGALYELI